MEGQEEWIQERIREAGVTSLERVPKHAVIGEGTDIELEAQEKLALREFRDDPSHFLFPRLTLSHCYSEFSSISACQAAAKFSKIQITKIYFSELLLLETARIIFCFEKLRLLVSLDQESVFSQSEEVCFEIVFI